ncbi:serine O-acetyltransferase [Congregibacter sp.]|uniref:serine O-acetyltransferase n=1 Tax=Congregibacter sp. TaxID=2744308 RepID=UPI0039E68091
MSALSKIPGDIGAKANWLYGRSDFRACLKATFADGTVAMLMYRLMQFAGDYRLTPIEMLFNKLCIILGGCVIGRGAKFGDRFVLIHSNGVVINGGVRGGNDLRIEHQVTIGAERGKSPTLGNNVFVGAGAKIIGDLHVGNGAKIGANAVVTKSVSADATAVGVPAREIRQPKSPQQQQSVVDKTSQEGQSISNQRLSDEPE